MADELSLKADAFDITLGNDYPWGSNMIVCNNAVILLYAYKLTKNKAYYDLGCCHLNYLLGANSLGISYVTSFGSHFANNPHHRLSISYNHTEEGMLVGGSASGLFDPFVKASCENMPKAKCYIDKLEPHTR